MAKEALAPAKPKKRLIVEVAPELFDALRAEATQLSNPARSYNVSDLVREILANHVIVR